MNNDSLRVGQKIYSLKYGWGNVIQGPPDPVAVSFNESVYSYDFLGGKAIPMDVDFTDAQQRGYTISEIADLFKNDLMTEREKEVYDKETAEATNNNDGFII